MDQPAKHIADHYRLQLGASWDRWFKAASPSLEFPGAFRFPVDVEQLCSAKPSAIWPGFMLPDTLPVIGNQYGDWICVRIGADGTLGELIHWYHGGGDWIPVGRRIEEALLHDAVDQYRPVRQQMLRGAFEMLAPDHLHEVSTRMEREDYQAWLTSGLSAADSPASKPLREIFATLHGGRYSDALRVLLRHDWAYEATACDLLEETLQFPLEQWTASAQPRHEETDGKALARWLFDSKTFPAPPDLSLSAGELPEQGWQLAEDICQDIVRRRQDLGWASDILGWCKQRSGRVAEAMQVYFDGRHASSFSNQAIRLRTHWFDQRFGKFSIAQLSQLESPLPAPVSEDPYLSIVRQAPAGQLLKRVQKYWQHQGDCQLAEGRAADAYMSYYQAGWDLGAPYLSDYLQILSALATAAEAAGWRAREVVARTHLHCLEARLQR